ncbi:MAG: DNA polymerase III subunit alpha, partial [Geminicoccaceae bacterium]
AVIARRCAYLSPARDPILPPFDTAGGRNEAQELRAQAEEGLEERLEHVVYLEAARARDVDMADLDVDTRAEIAAPYRKRLAFELDVIEQMKFPGYFLIVSDFIKWAKGQGIPVGPGRGSGAGSVAAWSLHITDLDPLRFGLLFERFLNPERVSMPDFDIDFCQDRRDEVIRYVQRKYGRDKVAAIITFGKLQARAALRDVGRVLGMPFGQVDRICKLVPFNPAKPPTIAQALEMEPRLAEERKADEQVDRMVEIALKLEGKPRHASTHAAGVVIGDRPLDQLVPLYRDPRSDMPVTQFNMKDVEKAGLVKFDFLGLTTLTMLRHAEELVNQRGTRLVLSALPLDNQAAYALLARGETAGVFQLESGGMRDALRKLKPDRFEDLIAMVSLYRPGPMENIPVYTDVKHGKEQASYLHPKLEPILKETNGVIIYQEQVMQIARDLAGYSLGGADILRRAMGKKIKEEMDKQRGVFVKGAVERNIEEGLANTIFDLIAKFASYGFNKSHAAAYALLAYQTAYLKANHTVEFFAASMTLEKDSQDKLVLFRAELADAGIALLPPDVNASGVDFEVEDTADGAAIRYALSAIRGVGSGAMALLVEERQSNGLYRDVCDLVARLGTGVLNKRLLEGLVRAGALDSLHDNRRQLNDHLDVLLRYAAAVAGAKASEQDSLFAGSADADVPTPRLAPVADWPSLERLGHEFTALGFYMSAHPLDGYRALLQRRGVVTYARLAAHIEANPGAAVHLAGVVLSKQERSGQRGRYAFVRLSDATGAFEVAVFSEVLSGARDLLDGATPLLVHADVRQDEGNLRIMALSIEPLDLSASRHSGTLEVTVAPETDLDRLFAMLAEATEQACGPRVCLVVPTGGQEETALELPDEVVLPFASRPDLERLPGVVRVRDL